LQRIHTAMLSGMVLFCIVSAVVHIPGRLAANGNLNKILQVIVLAVSFILIKTGLTIFERKLQAIPRNTPLLKKMASYKTAAIIKWAMIEVPVLLSVVSFLVTRNYAFIVLAFGLMVMFAFQGPVKQKIMLQLQIPEDEITQPESTQNN
jgi:hypothetical protein